MKRLFAVMLALSMVATLATTSMAVATLKLYVKDDDGYYIDQVDAPAPGQTVYALLTENKPSKQKASNDIEVVSNATDRKVSLISGSSFDIVKRKIGSGSTDYAYFAEIKIKEVSSSAYDEDGYQATGEVTYEDSDGDTRSFDVDFNIEYPEGYGDLTEDLQYYTYEKDDDIDLDLDDGESTFSATASGNYSVLASMSCDYDSTFGNKYPNANLDFYTGNGATFQRLDKGSELTIYASSGSYLYEIKNGALTDLTKTYDRDEDAFVVRSNTSSFTLGSYVVSDTKLSGATAASSSTASSSSNSTSTTPVDTYVPINPNTGAAA